MAVRSPDPFSVRIAVQWAKVIAATGKESILMGKRLSAAAESAISRTYTNAPSVPTFEEIRAVLAAAARNEANDLGEDIRFTLLNIMSGDETQEKEADTILGFE